MLTSALNPSLELFVGDTSHLVDAFLVVAAQHGQEHIDATELFKLLPLGVKSATAFFDKLTSLWRYDFGEPLTLQGSDQILLGTHQWPEVEHLYRALRSMDQRLPKGALLKYLERLSDRRKHQEVLFEARPLFYLAQGTSAEFEVVGYGQGNRTIDWRFSPNNAPDVLVEVKYRIGDVVQHIGPMVPHLNSGQDFVSSGPGRPELLFPSTFEKFMPLSPTAQLQGAWIYSNIKVERSELEAYFQALPPDLLHFAVLSNWHETGFLLSRQGVDREMIVNLFGIREGEDAVVG